MQPHHRQAHYSAPHATSFQDLQHPEFFATDEPQMMQQRMQQPQLDWSTTGQPG